MHIARFVVLAGSSIKLMMMTMVLMNGMKLLTSDTYLPGKALGIPISAATD